MAAKETPAAENEPKVNVEKLKALQLALDKIEKDHRAQNAGHLKKRYQHRCPTASHPGRQYQK